MRYDELKQEYARIRFNVFEYDSEKMTCEYQLGEMIFFVDLEWETTNFDDEEQLYDYIVNPVSGCYFIESDQLTEYPLEFGTKYKEWINEMVKLHYYETEFLFDYLQRDEDEAQYYWEYGV